jgi:hypothetical protein
MLAAVLLGGSELLVTEAAVSALLVATLSSTATARLLDVLIGGGVALALHTLVFPPEPVAGIARATGAVFDELGIALRDAAAALAAGDVRHARSAASAAENVAHRIDELQHAVVVGRDTVRWAPTRRRAGTDVERYERVLVHVDLAARNARVLARNVLVYVRSGRTAQPELAEALRELGLAASELPAQFTEPWRSGDVLRMALRGAGRATAAAERTPDIAVSEIAGLVRSIAVDVVRASEAGETAHSALTDAPTEELLAVLPHPTAV